MSRSYNDRRHQRYVHGKRRLKQDRAQHGGRQQSPGRILCSCFDADADQGRGKEFARFADTAAAARNPWKHWEPLPWEKKAPTPTEWE